MKMLETLTTEQKISLLNGNTVGMFPYIIKSTDVFYTAQYDLCLGYYTQRSGDKSLSHMYERFIKLAQDNEGITSTPEELMGNYIRAKYLSKWQLEYGLLLSTQYNPLKEFEETKSLTEDTTDKTEYNTDVTHTGTDTDTLTHNTSLAHSGTNTDSISQTDSKTHTGVDTETKTYDLSVEDTGEKGTNMTENRRDNSQGNIYGFNSATAVPDRSDGVSSELTTIGDAADNTTHNLSEKDGTETNATTYGSTESYQNSETVTSTLGTTEAKTGTETHQLVHGKTESKDGTDTRDLDRKVDEDVYGRRTAAADLLTKELDFRNKQIFFDIVYKDIDSIATLQIYI